MPWATASLFSRTLTPTVDSNRYPDGSLQSFAQESLSRNAWKLTQRLTDVQEALLEAFYLAVLGGGTEFWFYDVYETVPPFTYDPTAAAEVGRYSVIFEGNYQRSLDWGRSPSQFGLVEVA